MLNITIFNEFRHEKTDADCRAVYPDGIHKVLADFIGKSIDDCNFRFFDVDSVNDDLTEEILANTDVLIWWGHAFHHLVSDEVSHMVARAVRMGMGAIFLHSAHLSKPFIELMGTSCNLRWGDGQKEVLWVTDPLHPIAQGIDPYIVLPEDELYGEFFDIPEPDSLVFTSWFEQGYVFRSGCAYKRGMGRVFYFQPGHETYPIYKNEQIQKVIVNAVKWVTPNTRIEKLHSPQQTNPII